MDEYIKKSDALKASKLVYIECLYLDEEEYEEAEVDDIRVVFARDIESIPAADVEEVKHREREDDADDVYWGNYIVKKHCSECGYTPEFDRETELFNLTKRCPNCGAKMDGKRGDKND